MVSTFPTEATYSTTQDGLYDVNGLSTNSADNRYDYYNIEENHYVGIAPSDNGGPGYPVYSSVNPLNGNGTYYIVSLDGYAPSLSAAFSGIIYEQLSLV